MKNQMEYAEATETINGLKNLLPIVKSFTLTTRIKAEHKTKLEEVRQLLYKCQEVHFMYNPEYNHAFCLYRNEIEKQSKKERLDNVLHYCIETLYKDIHGHILELEKLQNEIIT